MILPASTLAAFLWGEYLLVPLIGFCNAWFDLEGPFPWNSLSLRKNISADSLSQPLYVSSG